MGHWTAAVGEGAFFFLFFNFYVLVEVLVLVYLFWTVALAGAIHMVKLSALV